jgi:hypothetical protein
MNSLVIDAIMIELKPVDRVGILSVMDSSIDVLMGNSVDTTMVIGRKNVFKSSMVQGSKLG